MAHQFETTVINFEKVRRCYRCGKKQTLKFERDLGGKIIARRWVPLLGRCPMDATLPPFQYPGPSAGDPGKPR